MTLNVLKVNEKISMACSLLYVSLELLSTSIHAQLNKPLGVLIMFNKTMSSFRLAALGVAVAGSMMAAQQAAAEVEVAASAAVSSMYLWRGIDLGVKYDETTGEKTSSGVPAISGDITVSAAGAYAGIWGSSGDATLGTEYDLFVGYGGSVEDFTYDVSLWAYTYPEDDALDTFGQASDLVISLGFGPVAFTYYDSLQGGYAYYTLGASMDQFSAKLGYSDPGEGDDTYTHLDLGYAYNENLSFTVSKMLDSDDGAGVDEDTLFVVSYSLPIEMK